MFIAYKIILIHSHSSVNEQQMFDINIIITLAILTITVSLIMYSPDFICRYLFNFLIVTEQL